jgi:hypothetical protein
MYATNTHLISYQQCTSIQHRIVTLINMDYDYGGACTSLNFHKLWSQGDYRPEGGGEDKQH